MWVESSSVVSGLPSSPWISISQLNGNLISVANFSLGEAIFANATENSGIWLLNVLQIQPSSCQFLPMGGLTHKLEFALSVATAGLTTLPGSFVSSGETVLLMVNFNFADPAANGTISVTDDMLQVYQAFPGASPSPFFPNLLMPTTYVFAGVSLPRG
jgi:hypothetical protein